MTPVCVLGYVFIFRGVSLRKAPPGGDLIRPLRHHLWSLHVFTILLQFLEMAVFFGGGVTDWSQMGDITQAPLGSG